MLEAVQSIVLVDANGVNPGTSGSRDGERECLPKSMKGLDNKTF
jgi:hypothetical protein